MEPFIADLINNPKIPKFIRYVIVIILSMFIIFLGITCTINSPFTWGKVFGVVLAIAMLITGIYLSIKIFKSTK